MSNRLSFNGIVEQVWEDGFSFHTGNRTLRVDSWDLYGDSTPRNVSIGQNLTISGEFDQGEFDAFSITLMGSSNGSGTQWDGNAPLANNSRINVIRGTNRSDDLIGGSGRDSLIGLGGDDDLFGRAGNDILAGGAGDDDLFGGAGNDILRGGLGEDDLIGGPGRDTLIGGAGLDTFVLQRNGNDIISDFQDGIDELRLSGGLSFNNLTLQQQGSNTLILNGGNHVALLLNVNVNAITIADLG